MLTRWSLTLDWASVAALSTSVLRNISRIPLLADISWDKDGKYRASWLQWQKLEWHIGYSDSFANSQSQNPNQFVNTYKFPSDKIWRSGEAMDMDMDMTLEASLSRNGIIRRLSEWFMDPFYSLSVLFLTSQVHTILKLHGLIYAQMVV